MDVTARLARRLLDSGIDLDRESLTRAGLRMLPEEAPLETPHAVTRAVDEVMGLGPLEELLREPDVSDVLVNGGGDVWIERAGLLERTELRLSQGTTRTAVERVIAPLGLRFDRASPSVDARLADGSRLFAALPPVSVDGVVMAIRRFTEAVPDLDALTRTGSVDPEGQRLLRSAVSERSNLVVAGSTGSGKTTLLNLLVKEIPPFERVVTIEDAAELRPSGHMVRLEARPANTEGRGAVTMSYLVRRALRLRPDRIIVGEVRGAEAADMLQAMSTGHRGSMSTVHGGSPEEALWRLASLAEMGTDAGGTGSAERRLREVVDLVVQMRRDGTRRVVAGIHSVTGAGICALYECPPRS